MDNINISFLSDQNPESFFRQTSAPPLDRQTTAPPSFARQSSAPLQEAVINANIALAESTSRARWWKILPIDLLKIGGLLLVIPALTNWKTTFFDGDTSKAAFVQSIVDTSRAVFAILVTVQLGQLSDAIGRRPLIGLGAFSVLMPLACLAYFPHELFIYYGVYAFAGLLSCPSAPQAYVADCSSQDDRARIFGLRGAAVSVVVMLTPGLGTLIELFYGRQSVAVVAAGTELAGVIAVLCLPESLPKEKRQPFVASVGCSEMVQTLRQLFQRRGHLLWDLSVLQFLRGLHSGIPFLFAFKALLDLKDEDFAILITINGVGGVLVQSLIMMCMTRSGFSQLSIMTFGIAVDAFGFLGYAVLDMYPMRTLLFLMSACHTFSGVYTPSITALATQGADNDKGFVLGAFGAVGSVASCVSPMLMGGLYQLSPVVPFILASCLNFLCLAFACRLRRRVRAELANPTSSLLSTEGPINESTSASFRMSSGAA